MSKVIDNWTPDDFYWMQQALGLAERGLYTTTPNPRVGCIIVRDQQLLGSGWTQPAGQDHAEIQALKTVQVNGNIPEDATVYVTLEPCSHYGRTPPCVRALIEAKVARVVVATTDPNPLVSGQGIAQLKAAGILVEEGLMASAAIEQNLGFGQRMRNGRPWVRLKLASSLDGHTALSDGRSQWLTGLSARRDGHHWRARACAVLTGGNTLRLDNPQLNVRLVETPRQPVRIVLSRRLPNLALNWRLQDQYPVWWITSQTALTNDHVSTAMALEAYRRAWPSLEIIPILDLGGPLDCKALLDELGKRELNELHIEAGPELAGVFIAAGYVDELILYWAPKFLGEGSYPLVKLAPALNLDLQPLCFHKIDCIGEDIRAILRKNVSQKG